MFVRVGRAEIGRLDGPEPDLPVIFTAKSYSAHSLSNYKCWSCRQAKRGIQTLSQFLFFSLKRAQLPLVVSSHPEIAAARKSKYPGQSVRAIPMRILTVSRKRSQGVQLLVEEYKEKVRHYCMVEIVHIKSNPKNTSDIKAQIEGEDILVMQNVRPEDLVVMLDEHGRDIGSKEMAELVGDAGRTGSSRLVFCIGGPYGHGAQLRARANVAIRLSSMVLNHQIALIVLLEQLYRVREFVLVRPS